MFSRSWVAGVRLEGPVAHFTNEHETQSRNVERKLVSEASVGRGSVSRRYSAPCPQSVSGTICGTVGFRYVLAEVETARRLALRAGFSLERAKGFEPSTTCLGSRSSTTELRPLDSWLLLFRPQRSGECGDVSAAVDQLLRRGLCSLARLHAAGYVWLCLLAPRRPLLAVQCCPLVGWRQAAGRSLCA